MGEQTLEDYEIKFDHILIKCDSTSAISLSKNIIQHLRTKYIEMRRHFQRDHKIKEDIVTEFMGIEHQLEYIFTKPLSEDHFCKIRRNLSFIHAKNVYCFVF
jgi:hypothetical protein